MQILNIVIYSFLQLASLSLIFFYCQQSILDCNTQQDIFKFVKFAVNSSSSSFIITGKDNIEKAKYIIDNAQDIYGDYYEVNDKLFTSGISDCSEIFSQLCSLTQEDEACALNGEPYAGDDDEEVEDCYAILEGDRGVGTIYISKQYLDT